MKNKKKLSEIKLDIEELFEIPDIADKYRGREIVMYRNLFYILSKKYTFESLQKIGKEVNRDHTTVIHGINQYEVLIKYHENIKYGQIILEGKYTDEEFLKSSEDNIEVVYCNLLENKILTKRNLEIKN